MEIKIESINTREFCALFDRLFDETLIYAVNVFRSRKLYKKCFKFKKEICKICKKFHKAGEGCNRLTQEQKMKILNMLTPKKDD